MQGPAIVESETTTVVIEPDVTFVLQPSGTLHMSFGGYAAKAPLAGASRQTKRS
jgi:hypothetical protein